MKVTSKHIILIIVVISICSCNFFKKNKPQKDLNKTTNQITIIYNSYFKDSLLLVDEDYKKGDPKANYSPVISYNNENFVLDDNIICLNSKTYIDTIRIVSNKQIILKHKYNLDDFYFIANPGDTLVYNPINNIPSFNYYKKVKKNYNNSFYAFEINKRVEKYFSDDFSYFFMKEIILNPKDDKPSFRSYLLRRLKNLSKQKTYLDSLKNRNQIDKDYYNLYTCKNKYDSINLLFNNNLYPTIDVLSLEKFVNNDTLLKFDFYKTYLKNLVKSKYNIETINYGNNRVLNYEKAYDVVEDNNFIKGNCKNYLLFNYLNDIANSSSLDSFNKYYDRFKTNIKDTTYINIIDEKYLTNYNKLKDEKSNTILLNYNKEDFNLKDIIEENKGNVIYIDFWASWCKPCRKAMPKSKELQAYFTGKKIIFIYISIDKNFDDWINASSKEHLINYKYSYFSINYPKADLFKNLKLNTIPRYIIYDSNGELVYPNAPGPESVEAKKMLDNYLLNN